MSDVIPSPNMSLPVPVPGVEPGPQYATDVNNSLGIIDGHNHVPGSGVQIPSAGLSINADLPFNTNNATLLRSVRFSVNASPITGASPDLGCIYVSGADLYYNDENGNQVQITSGGAVNVSGAVGFSGLPSGTASAAFLSSNGTFRFQQATSTGANLDVASVAIRYPGSYPTPSGNYVQLQAPTSLATGYSITLPANVPGASGALLTSDTSGILSYSFVDSTSLQYSGGTLSIKSNPAIAGTYATIGGLPALMMASNASGAMTTLRGLVGAAGNLSIGEGATATKPGTGIYTVTFTTNFSASPVVVVNQSGLGAGAGQTPLFYYVYGIDSTKFNVYVQTPGGVATDGQFTFVAIGPR